MRLSSYALALGLTLAVEVPLVAALYPGRRRRMMLACAVATTATHLILHFVVFALVPRQFAPLFVGEAFATLAEAAAYAAVDRQLGLALFASGLANGASFGAGLLLLR